MAGSGRRLRGQHDLPADRGRGVSVGPYATGEPVGIPLGRPDRHTARDRHDRRQQFTGADVCRRADAGAEHSRNAGRGGPDHPDSAACARIGPIAFRCPPSHRRVVSAARHCDLRSLGCPGSHVARCYLDRLDRGYRRRGPRRDRPLGPAERRDGSDRLGACGGARSTNRHVSGPGHRACSRQGIFLYRAGGEYRRRLLGAAGRAI